MLIQECICELLWVFALLISSHISLHSEKIQEAISIILYCYNFLMASHVIYFGESFMDCRDECVLCSCWVECSVNGCQVHLILGMDQLWSFFTDFKSGWPAYLLMRWDIMVAHHCIRNQLLLYAQSVCSMKLEAPAFNTYIFTIILSSWWTVPFTST